MTIAETLGQVSDIGVVARSGKNQKKHGLAWRGLTNGPSFET